MVESQIRFPLVANETACKIKACWEVCEYCDSKDFFILPVDLRRKILLLYQIIGIT